MTVTVHSRCIQDRSIHLACVQRGVVLLEVLVAFSILAVSLAVLLQSVSANLRQHGVVENRLIATTYATNIIAGLGIETSLKVAEKRGEFDERFTWRLSVSELSPAEIGLHDKEATFKLLAIKVAVEWQEGSVTKQYVLETKRIAAL